MRQFTIIPDSGPDGEQIWLTIWLPKLRSRPPTRFLRIVAEVYALAAELNGKTQQRFGLNVVTVRLESEEGNISIHFDFDPDFSDAYSWRDEIGASVVRIVVSNGGVADRSYLAWQADIPRSHAPTPESLTTSSTQASDRLRNRLLSIVRSPTAEMRRTLDALKAKAMERAERRTFVWDSLTQSFATMGNSRGWAGLVENAENARRISYNVVKLLPSANRLAHIEAVLRDAVVRMPGQKAQWLVANFNRIELMGGAIKAREEALAAPGRDAKLAFMLQFDGIGDKYARNIWMDVYHPDFHDAVAVDERIKKISKVLGYTFSNYSEHERFYQEIARDAGLQPWELDRLLYQFNDVILRRLGERRR